MVSSSLQVSATFIGCYFDYLCGIKKYIMSKNTEPSFRTAFSSAKKSGKKTFKWNSKNYTTQTAEEKATSLKKKGGKPGKKFVDAANKSYYNEYVAKGGTGKPAGKDLQKSTQEIANSYNNVALNGIEGRKKTKYGRQK